jgi:hypothetical protein
VWLKRGAESLPKKKKIKLLCGLKSEIEAILHNPQNRKNSLYARRASLEQQLVNIRPNEF